MAISILSAVVGGVVSKAASVAAEQMSLAWGFKKELQRLGNSLEMIGVFLLDAEEKQKEINSVKLWLQRLKDVAHEADDVLGSNVETVSFLDDSHIVGRKNDVSNVVDLLVSPKDEQEMLDHFPIQHAFVSDNLNVITTKLKEKIEQAKGENEQFKYLLVLDDVWNVDKGEELKCCLLGLNKDRGNKVVVTTRIEEVASRLETLPNHKYQPGILKDEECWSIIEEKASRDSVLSPKLVSIGKEIAKQCQGLPLAAKVIGGTMCNTERSQASWLKIQRSDVWNSAESILKLSFDH
ncbi:hypothetical protein V6N13_047162 [Hibiscus sabdariffa]